MQYLDVGIDLGSTSVKIYVKNLGLVANVKSVIAVNRQTGKLIDVGVRAYKMLGRAPIEIEVVEPLLNGVVANLEFTKLFIDEILAEVVNVPRRRMRVFLCVHSGETEMEKLVLINNIFFDQTSHIFLVQESVATGFGAGFDLNSGVVVVNIGGGTTDMAYIDASRVFRSSSVKLAGKTIDSAIIEQVCTRYGLVIGKLSAEKLKIQAASINNWRSDDKNDRVFKLSGKDKFSHLPKRVFLNSSDVHNLIRIAIDEIVNAIVGFVCILPVDLIANSQLVLAGGTSLIDGFAEYVSKKVKLPIIVANDPIGCAVFGLSELFNMTDLKNSFLVDSA